MNMTNEPIRLPALIALVVVLACAVAISLLLGLDLQVAIAVVLGVLAAVGAPVVAVTESKRARTDSPATVQHLYRQAVARVDADAAARGDDAASLSAPDFATPPSVAELEPAELDALRELLAERS